MFLIKRKGNEKVNDVKESMRIEGLGNKKMKKSFKRLLIKK